MATLNLTATTAACTVTTNAATVTRDRVITCPTVELAPEFVSTVVRALNVVATGVVTITTTTPAAGVYAGPGDTILDSVDVDDQLAQSVFDAIGETVEVDDGLGLDETTSPLLDTVTVLDSVGQTTAYADHIVESVTVEDAAKGAALDAIVETVRVSETINQAFVERLNETVTILDEVEQYRTVLDALVESVEVVDSINTAFLDTLDEVISVEDVIFDATGTVVDSIVDSVTPIDFVRDAFAGVFADSLQDTVIVLDTLAHGPSSSVDSLLETVVVLDTLYARDPRAMAWVMNVETGAPSFYDNFEFTSMIEYKGLLLGSSAEGLFLLGRSGDDRDSGTKVQSEVVTGLLDWNSTYLKRLRDVYLGYTGGQLELDIETYNQPVPKYTYDLIERDADAPRNNRIRTGRGLKSRFWRFTLRNVSGKWHQIYDISANVDISNRRL